MLLSDGYLASGTEPWLLPDVDDLPSITAEFATEVNGLDDEGREVYWPYVRNEDLARPWAIPGTEGLITASVASRNKTAPATSATAETDFMVRLRRQIPRSPRSSHWSSATRTRHPRRWLGVDVGCDHERNRSPASIGTKVASVHLRHCIRLPRISGDPRAFRPCRRSGDEPRTAHEIAAGEFSSTRSSQVSGQPFTPRTRHQDPGVAR